MDALWFTQDKTINEKEYNPTQEEYENAIWLSTDAFKEEYSQIVKSELKYGLRYDFLDKERFSSNEIHDKVKELGLGCSLVLIGGVTTIFGRYETEYHNNERD